MSKPTVTTPSRPVIAGDSALPRTTMVIPAPKPPAPPKNPNPIKKS
jgi:hypothetical protein